LVIGAPKASCMVQGLEPEHDVALFIGYHAGASDHGVLAHTFSINFTELRLNGSPVTETEVNALLAAQVGVAVGLVTGDDNICTTAEKALPGVATVVVKQAQGFAAAESLHPNVACEHIEDAAARVVGNAAELRPIAVPDEFVVEADFAAPLSADFAANLPGAERLSAHTLRRTAADPTELLSVITSWYYLASLGGQQIAGIAQRR
jgi:D-amino peptidase